MRLNSGSLPHFGLRFKQPRIDALERIAVLIPALDCDAEALDLGREDALEVSRRIRIGLKPERLDRLARGIEKHKARLRQGWIDIQRNRPFLLNTGFRNADLDVAQSACGLGLYRHEIRP